MLTTEPSPSVTYKRIVCGLHSGSLGSHWKEYLIAAHVDPLVDIVEVTGQLFMAGSVGE